MSSDLYPDLEIIVDDHETIIGEDGKPTKSIHTYRINRCIGEGGMATVYAATYFAPDAHFTNEDCAEAPIVAVKYLRPEFLESQLSRSGKSPLARFNAEAQTMMSVNHPNIIRILRQGKDQQGRPFIAMEYIPGGQTLQSAIDKAKRKRDAAPIKQPIRGSLIPWRNLAPLLNQILSALEELHKKGIFHRDVKPENLLICLDKVPNYWVKLTDFGIAKRLTQTADGLQRLTQTGAHIGTPTHMAPEQIETIEQRDEGKVVCKWPVGPWTDVWAFGVLLYQLVTGELPFASENIAKLWTSILDLDVVHTPMSTYVEQLHPQIEEIVRRCLTKRPWERIQYIGEVRQMLEAVDHPAESIPAPRPTPDVDITKPMDRLPPRQSSRFFGKSAWRVMIGGVSLLLFTILFLSLHWRPTHVHQGEVIASASTATQPTTAEPVAPATASTVSRGSSNASANPAGKSQLKQSQPLLPKSKAQLRFELAKTLIQQRRYASATAVLKLVIDDAPDFAPAYRDLALCHLRQGHRDEAKRLVAVYNTYLAEPLPKELQL